MEDFVAGIHGPEPDGPFEDALRERYGEGYDRFAEGDIVLYGSRIVEFDDVVVAFNGYLRDIEQQPAARIAECYRRLGPRFPAMVEGNHRTAVYNREQERLLLATDRLGSRPILYHTGSDGLVFASSLSPFTAILEPGLDRQALSRFLISPLSAGFSTGRTLLKGVRKADAGKTLVWDRDRRDEEQYWTWPRGRVDASQDEAAQRIEALLLRSAEKTRAAVGDDASIAVSGSTDSALLAGILAEVTPGTITTVTYGFEEAHFDAGRAVAEELGARHEEIRYPYRLADTPQLWAHEQPLPALSAFPFRSLATKTGAGTLYTGNFSMLPFPYLPRLEAVERFARLKPVARLMNRLGGRQIARALGARWEKGFDVLSSPYVSTPFVNDKTITKSAVSAISGVDGYREGRALERALDRRWRLTGGTPYDTFHRLQVTEQYHAFPPLFSTHTDIFTYTPLLAYTLRLPPERKREQTMQDCILQRRFPHLREIAYRADTRRVDRILTRMVDADWDRFEAAMHRLGERGFMDADQMEEVFAGYALEQLSTDATIHCMALYHLERWLETFIDRDRPWEKPGQ